MENKTNHFLKKWGLKDAIRESFALYFGFFIKFMIPAFLIYFCLFSIFGYYLIDRIKDFLYSCIFNYSSKQDEQAFSVISNNIIPIIKIHSLILVFLLIGFIMKTFLTSYFINLIQGKAYDLEEHWVITLKKTLLRNFLPAMLAGLTVQLAIQAATFIGLIALVLGAIFIMVWLSVSWIFVLPVVVIERSGPFEAMAKSFLMIKSHFWQTLKYALVLGFLIAAPILLLQGIVSWNLIYVIFDIDTMLDLQETINPTNQELLDYSMGIFKRIENNYILYSSIFAFIYSLIVPLNAIVPTILFYNIKAQKLPAIDESNILAPRD